MGRKTMTYSPDLTEAQHAVIEEVAADAFATLEYAGFTAEHARCMLIMEAALDLAAVQGAPRALECLEEVLHEMRLVARELEP